MNRTTFVWVVAAACLAYASVGMGRPPTPEDVYEGSYGKESRSVEASKDPELAVAFARKLITEALLVMDDKAFAEFLLERAYDLGRKDVAGYPVAIEAAKAIVLERVPARPGWKTNFRRPGRLLPLARFLYQQA